MKKEITEENKREVLEYVLRGLTPWNLFLLSVSDKDLQQCCQWSLADRLKMIFGTPIRPFVYLLSIFQIIEPYKKQSLELQEQWRCTP